MFTTRIWIGVGAFYGFLAVALGAFGAHGLAKVLTPEDLKIYHTATQYMTTHGLALFLLGIWGDCRNPVAISKWYVWAGRAFTVGVALFSGSLFLILVTGVKSWGAVTPIGGLLFLIGWFFVAQLARSIRSS